MSPSFHGGPKKADHTLYIDIGQLPERFSVYHPILQMYAVLASEGGVFPKRQMRIVPRDASNPDTRASPTG